MWAVALLALATSLDSSVYGGRHTQAALRMGDQIAVHFR